MALKEKTREEDERLRRELKHANLEKFKKALKPLIDQSEKRRIGLKNK